MNAVHKNACLIRSVVVADDDLDFFWTLSYVSDTKKDGSSLKKQTQQRQRNQGPQADSINLIRFSYLIFNNKERCSEKLLLEGADRFSSLLTWNTGLTYLCLRSKVVFYSEAKSFLDIILSLKHLRALTISMSRKYHTFLKAIVLAMNMLSRQDGDRDARIARRVISGYIC